MPLGWLGGGDGGEAPPAHLQDGFAAAGADVSGVRLHTGAESAEMAEDVSARAFAFGQDVHFGAGEYQPGTPDGDHLIAHELAHTVQQRGAPTAAPQLAPLDVSQPGDAAEVEADQFADAIVSGSSRAAALPTQRPSTIARQVVPAQQPQQAAPQAPAAPAAQQGQQPAAPAGAATFTDADFAATFRDTIGTFRTVAAGRPISALFTANEQRALAQYLTDHHLPPVGTFATFFSTVDDSLRFTFSAELHVRDRNLSGRTARRNNGQVVETRATRANDCGDWVGRVVTYARNEPYISRAERRRNHLASPDSLFRYGDGNRLEATPQGTNEYRSHAAVDRSIVERLLPGDWVMIHWHHGRRAGEDNHSMMFMGWAEPRWNREGYRRARFANQTDNTAGGGEITQVSVCADASKDRYIYNVRSSRPLNAAGHPGAGGAQPAAAHAQQQAAPEVPAVLAPIIAAHPEKVAAAVEDDHAAPAH